MANGNNSNKWQGWKIILVACIACCVVSVLTATPCYSGNEDVCSGSVAVGALVNCGICLYVLFRILGAK